MSKATSALDALFVSKVRIKVLKFLLLRQDKKLHLRGIVREISEEINAVRRELSRLEEVNIVISESESSKKFFFINRESVYYEDLLIMMHKAFGLGGKIIGRRNQLGEVKFAILTHDFLNPPEKAGQQIDLVVVGNIILPKLTELIEEVQQSLKREINYTVLSEREFFLKKKRRDPFVYNTVLHRHILLIGDHEELIS